MGSRELLVIPGGGSGHDRVVVGAVEPHGVAVHRVDLVNIAAHGVLHHGGGVQDHICVVQLAVFIVYVGIALFAVVAVHRAFGGVHIVHEGRNLVQMLGIRRDAVAALDPGTIGAPVVHAVLTDDVGDADHVKGLLIRVDVIVMVLHGVGGHSHHGQVALGHIGKPVKGHAVGVELLGQQTVRIQLVDPFDILVVFIRNQTGDYLIIHHIIGHGSGVVGGHIHAPGVVHITGIAALFKVEGYLRMVGVMDLIQKIGKGVQRVNIRAAQLFVPVAANRDALVVHSAVENGVDTQVHVVFQSGGQVVAGQGAAHGPVFRHLFDQIIILQLQDHLVLKSLKQAAGIHVGIGPGIVGPVAGSDHQLELFTGNGFGHGDILQIHAAGFRQDRDDIHVVVVGGGDLPGQAAKEGGPAGDGHAAVQRIAYGAGGGRSGNHGTDFAGFLRRGTFRTFGGRSARAVGAVGRRSAGTFGGAGAFRRRGLFCGGRLGRRFLRRCLRFLGLGFRCGGRLCGRFRSSRRLGGYSRLWGGRGFRGGIAAGTAREHDNQQRRHQNSKNAGFHRLFSLPNS